MIFLVQFGINKDLQIFQRPQSALALRARALLLVFEKFTRAYLFQIALEIMWLPTLISTFGIKRCKILCFYEAFLPITCPGPRNRLNHLYSPYEEGLGRPRRRQVTPALGLIQVISGVGEGLPWKYSTEYDPNFAWFLPILGFGIKKIRWKNIIHSIVLKPTIL